MTKSLGKILLALLAYLIFAYVYWGHYWFFNSSPRIVGRPEDPFIFIWMFKWWLYAAVHHMNPFIVHFISTPNGVNLMKVTNLPLFSVLLMPVTYFFGPYLSYNIAITLAPICSAFSMYLLLRWSFKKDLAAWFGGYIFGFSTFVVAHMGVGHVNLVCLCFLPLSVWICAAYSQHQIKFAWSLLLLTLCFLAQFLISKEIMLILFTGLFVLGVVAYLFFWDKKRAITRAWILFIIAFVLACIILSPLVYLYFQPPVTFSHHPPDVFTADLLNYVVPSPLTYLLGVVFTKISLAMGPVTLWEKTAYLGAPLILVIFLTLCTVRRRFVYGMFAFLFIFFLLSLGGHLIFAGRSLFSLPWDFLLHMPVYEYLLPARYIVWVTFAAAFLLTCWLIRTKVSILIRYLIAIIVIVFLFPNPSPYGYRLTSKIPHKTFMPMSKIKALIPKGSNVLVVTRHSPILMYAMISQLNTNLYYNLSKVNLGPGGMTIQNPIGGFFGFPKEFKAFNIMIKGYLQVTKTNVIIFNKDEYKWFFEKSFLPYIEKTVKYRNLIIAYPKKQYQQLQVHE